MEMMKEAPLFLLDEPTSGLDSASSINLFNALHTLAYMGYNIVSTIHQPRQEIVALFDDIILLSPNGRIVYGGPTAGISVHFCEMGYTPAPEANIADFVMDVLAGFVKKDVATTAEKPEIVADSLCTWWETHRYSLLYEEIDKIPRIPQEPDEPYTRRETLSIIVVTILVTMLRQIRTFQRALPTFRFTCALFFIFGVVTALLFGVLDLSVEGFNGLSSQVSASQLTFGLLSLSFGLRLFKNDSLVRRREEEGGIWLGPYVFGKLAGCIPELIAYPLMFLFGYFPFVQSAASFVETWWIFLLFQLAVVGMANFIAVVVPGKSTSLVGNGVLVILWSFGGIAPALPSIRKRMNTFGDIMNKISPFKWSFEMQIVSELNQYSDFYRNVLDTVSRLYLFEYDSIPRNTWVLVLFYVVSSLMTYLWLVWARDHFRILREFKEFVTKLWLKIFPVE